MFGKDNKRIIFNEQLKRCSYHTAALAPAI